MTNNTVKVGVAQMSCSADVKQNEQKAAQLISGLARGGAQIICLPELYKSHYFCQQEDHGYFDLAETIPGKGVEELQALAKANDVVLIASLFEKRATGVYHNTAVVIDADGRFLGKYRKMHIPDDPCYLEKFYFTPGDLGYQVFETRYAKLGVLICWDQWYPEAARLTALKGAEIIFYPTAIGWLGEDKKDHGERQFNAWKSVQVGHAVANAVFVVTPNRVGTEGNIEFWGGSFVVDPFGATLFQAGQKEETAVVDCNLSLIEETRRGWPFLRDRRVDSYEGILKRYDD
ncbi:MAG: carbon-nitrogen hydrolase [Deltaproteobacteria bacterium]|nr:carbon-nitrogen hydrolase [Deltaproteobacteria bacterium]